MAKMEVQAEEKPKQVLAQLGRDGEGGVLNLGFSNPLHCAREKHDGPLFALLLLLCVWKGHKDATFWSISFLVVRLLIKCLKFHFLSITFLYHWIYIQGSTSFIFPPLLSFLLSSFFFSRRLPRDIYLPRPPRGCTSRYSPAAATSRSAPVA